MVVETKLYYARECRGYFRNYRLLMKCFRALNTFIALVLNCTRLFFIALCASVSSVLCDPVNPINLNRMSLRVLEKFLLRK